MRNQVAFVVYAIFLFVVITITQARPSKRKENIKALQRKVQSLMHPCDTAPRGTVIHTLNGDIICLQKTEQELQRQLEQNGGYNRRYAAATLAEAKKNFKNMFKIYGREYENTTDWQRWRNSDILKHDKGSFVEEHLQREGMISGRISRFGNYGDTRQRRSNDDSEIMKRGDPGINIQCLPGGRETEKGIHLCPACQRCTELSKDFFPRYINELTCKDSKSGNSSQNLQVNKTGGSH
ncbi:uncharacterized protein LOC116286883 isoform X2 [Actinia tenebrosa]|uniref:Uncharacterized protein LOC116286883 isoform X2 n=1 Tax=Actinia tenebrosa TaxID=6105 RepID=A0A6P8H1T0_ACTTE|nr:uncharacterized protein LOC116286883 isoform X2 [Actinia tenebrosa]